MRIGKIRDSSLKIKRAGEVTLIPVASLAYLKGKEKINSPRDLLMHQCLSLNLYQTGSRWVLRSAGKTENVPVQAKIISNQMSSLLKVALTDGGVALIPIYLCQTIQSINRT